MRRGGLDWQAAYYEGVLRAGRHYCAYAQEHKAEPERLAERKSQILQSLEACVRYKKGRSTAVELGLAFHPFMMSQGQLAVWRDYVTMLLATEETAVEREARFRLYLAHEALCHRLGDREAQAEDLAALEGLLDERLAVWEAEVALRRAHYGEAVGDYRGALVAAKTAVVAAQREQQITQQIEAHQVWGMALRQLADYPAAKEQFLQALRLSQQNECRGLEGALQRQLGTIAYSDGDIKLAVDYHQQALALAEKEGDKRLKGMVHNSLGVIYKNTGRSEQALTHYQLAIDLFREIGHRRRESMALDNIGGLVLERGEYQKASRYFEEAYQMRRSVGDLSGQGLSLNRIGILHGEQGAYQQAQHYFKQALTIFQQIGNRHWEGMALGNIAETLLHHGDYSQAYHYCQQVVKNRREVGKRAGEALALSNAGLISLYIGQYEMAEGYLQQALTVATEVNFPLYQSLALSNLAFLRVQQGESEQARAYGQQALELVEKEGIHHQSGVALTYLGDAWRLAEAWNQAGEAYQQALALRREAGQEDMALEPLAGLASVALARGEPEAAREYSAPIEAYIETHGWIGNVVIPLRIYWVCYEVLAAVGEVEGGTAVLQQAYNHLQQKAAQIEQKHFRHSYLHDIAAHRAIRHHWSLLQEDG